MRGVSYEEFRTQNRLAVPYSGDRSLQVLLGTGDGSVTAG